MSFTQELIHLFSEIILKRQTILSWEIQNKNDLY